MEILPARRNFIIRTYSHPLRHFKTQYVFSSRKFRWIFKTMVFNFKITPIKEKSNIVSEGLSRQNQNSSYDNEYPKQVLKQPFENTSKLNLTFFLRSNIKLVLNVQRDYEKHEESKEIVLSPKETYDKIHVLLYEDNRLCVPKEIFRKNILRNYHVTPSKGRLGQNQAQQCSTLLLLKSSKQC